MKPLEPSTAVVLISSSRSGQRKRFDRATVISACVATVAFLAGVVGGAACVFTTDVGVDIQLRRRVELERTESLIAADQRQGAIRTCCRIGKASSAVTPDAIATEEVETDIHLLGNGDAAIGADAATGAGIVVSSGTGNG